MMTLQKPLSLLAVLFVVLFPCFSLAQDGDGSVTVSGELKKWHVVTLDLSGPFAKETDNAPNPFRDYQFVVRFVHAESNQSTIVMGYFAADGRAADTSADEGNVWKCKFRPNQTGEWTYETQFLKGENIGIVPENDAEECVPYSQQTGRFDVAESDSPANDFRQHGRIQYVGKHYLVHADSKLPFIKVGPDSPETFLAYEGFDGTLAVKPKKSPLKNWQPHVRDWREGDPTWGDGKGKGIIGAVNYLADQGLNSFSFLPYNVDGDGHNVWPHVSDKERLHFDVSKLDQWGVLFEHAQDRGLMLHFKLQETENDDHRLGHKESKTQDVKGALDGGKLGTQRRLYLKELVARFGHALALEWNLGEENTQSPEEQRAMAEYLRAVDPYDHLIVLHTYPNQQNKKYPPLLGDQSEVNGASLQNAWNKTHQRTLEWVRRSAEAGKPWVVCNDEQNKATYGVPPDPGFEGFEGRVNNKGKKYDLHDIRKQTLWGNLMAGGGGVMYYFGYQLAENDLRCENFRSREQSWEYCRIARDFFREQQLPLNEMTNRNELVGNADGEFGPWCLAQSGKVYLVYLPKREAVTIDLSEVDGEFSGQWFNPKAGDLQDLGRALKAGDKVEVAPPESLDDSVLLLRRIER